MELIETRNKLIDLNRNICEEKTKIYLVMPFIKYLQYDVFSPLDLIPEHKPEYYTGNDRVDFAICSDGIPKIYVEVKRLNTKLDERHITWLAKYFNSDPYINLGILTNGERYLFFTDSKHENLMDTEPFYEFNLRYYNFIDEYLIDYFSKSNFNGRSIEYCINTIKSINNIQNAFRLLYLNQDYFQKLKAKGNDEVMKEIYKVANITEDDINLQIAYKILPLQKL